MVRCALTTLVWAPGGMDTLRGEGGFPAPRALGGWGRADPTLGSVAPPVLWVWGWGLPQGWAWLQDGCWDGAGEAVGWDGMGAGEAVGCDGMGMGWEQERL